MPQSYPSELIALVAKELEAVGPTLIGAAEQARHGAPRRFVWVPSDGVLRGPRSASKVDGAEMRFSVECWGGSMDDAWWMVGALLQAIQRALGGRNYEGGAVRPGGQALTHAGFVWSVEISLLLHFPSTDLQIPPPLPKGKPVLVEGELSVPLEPPSYSPTGEQEVVITAVAQATPATSAPGDGVLESEET